MSISCHATPLLIINPKASPRFYIQFKNNLVCIPRLLLYVVYVVGGIVVEVMAESGPAANVCSPSSSLFGDILTQRGNPASVLSVVK